MGLMGQRGGLVRDEIRTDVGGEGLGGGCSGNGIGGGGWNRDGQEGGDGQGGG